jgi:YesN/AraC family two-component response regulator
MIINYASKNLWIDKIEEINPRSMPIPHSHDTYEIFFLTQLDGNATITIDNKIFELNEGCAVIVNKNLVHQTNFKQATFRRRYSIEIRSDLLKDELGIEFGLSIPGFFKTFTGVHYLDHNELSQIENSLKIIYDESVFREKYYENIVLLRVLEILMLMNRHFEMQNKYKKLSAGQAEIVEPIVLYIMDHIREPLSLDTIANFFFIDKSYLSHIFKKYTGQTVHGFINERKIEQAKLILTLHPNSKTQYITNFLGFSNTSYFCKIFKRYAGTTVSNFNKIDQTFL